MCIWNKPTGGSTKLSLYAHQRARAVPLCPMSRSLKWRLEVQNSGGASGGLAGPVKKKSKRQSSRKSDTEKPDSLFATKADSSICSQQ